MEDIEAVLEKGHFVVMPLDMCGAIAMKRHILSIDAEKRNRQICDYAVNNMDIGAATRELSDVLKSNCL